MVVHLEFATLAQVHATLRSMCGYMKLRTLLLKEVYDVKR